MDTVSFLRGNTIHFYFNGLHICLHASAFSGVEVVHEQH